MKNLKLICLVLVSALFISACSCSKTKEYTVTFDSNGGTSVTSQTVKENELVKEPTNPSYEGYTFDGWYDGDVKFDFSTKITKDITLKAKWTQSTVVPDDNKDNQTDKEDKTDDNKETTKTYTVTFNSDGGSKVSAKKVKENSKVSKPTNPTKSGYKFLGWYLDNKSYNFNSKVTKDITLVAKWEKVNNTSKEEEVKTVSVESISLSKSSLKLEVKETSTLTATVTPNNATNKTVTWKSSDETVATVDKNGKVTAVKAGTATITATADGKEAKATVTVVGYYVDVVDTANSSIGQAMYYIKNTEGKTFSGTIKVTYKAGDSENVDITTSGIQYVKSTISKVEIVKVNK